MTVIAITPSMEIEFIPLPEMRNYPNGWSNKLMDVLIWGEEGEAGFMKSLSHPRA